MNASIIEADIIVIAQPRNTYRALAIIVPIPLPPPVITATKPSHENRSAAASELVIWQREKGFCTSCLILTFNMLKTRRKNGNTLMVKI